MTAELPDGFGWEVGVVIALILGWLGLDMLFVGKVDGKLFAKVVADLGKVCRIGVVVFGIVFVEVVLDFGFGMDDKMMDAGWMTTGTKKRCGLLV